MVQFDDPAFVGRILLSLAGFMNFFGGTGKCIKGHPMYDEMCTQFVTSANLWGIGQHPKAFRLVVGVSEVVFGLGLCINWLLSEDQVCVGATDDLLAAWHLVSAPLVGVIMLGASLTHVLGKDPVGKVVVPAVFAAMAWGGEVLLVCESRRVDVNNTATQLQLAALGGGLATLVVFLLLHCKSGNSVAQYANLG